MGRNSFEIQLAATLDLMGAILPEPDQIALADITPELREAYSCLAERDGAKTIKELIKTLAERYEEHGLANRDCVDGSTGSAK